jgi:hypothetical protein
VGGWVGGGGQAVRTNGYVCESLATLAGIGQRYLDLSGPTIGNGSQLIALLTAPSIDGGGVPLTCASNAAATIASFLHAFVNNKSLADQDTQTLLMQTIEMGLGGFTRRLLTGAALGERRTVTAGRMSAISVSRMSAAAFSGQNAVLKQQMLSDSGSTAVEFVLPPNFANDVFGETTPLIDVQLSMYGAAPASANRSLVSGLSGLTVSLINNPSKSVEGLSQPIIITIPLSTPIAAASTLISSQFQCVFWNGISYDSRGCSVFGLIVQRSVVTAVKCACTHLTTFAISYNSQFVEVKPSPGSTSLANGTDRAPVAETTAMFSSTAVHRSTSPSIAGRLLVSCNLTGSFGTVSSFETLVQQKDVVRSIISQGITASLRTVLGNVDGMEVTVVVLCWAGQCLTFQNRRGAVSSNPAGQLHVEFHVVCSSQRSLSQAATSVMSTSFRSILVAQISSLAQADNLGNWSVIASVPEISSVDSGVDSSYWRPNIKYNVSIVAGSTTNSNSDVSDQVRSGKIKFPAYDWFGCWARSGITRADILPFQLLFGNATATEVEATSRASNKAEAKESNREPESHR